MAAGLCNCDGSLHLQKYGSLQLLCKKQQRCISQSTTNVLSNIGYRASSLYVYLLMPHAEGLRGLKTFCAALSLVGVLQYGTVCFARFLCI